MSKNPTEFWCPKIRRIFCYYNLEINACSLHHEKMKLPIHDSVRVSGRHCESASFGECGHGNHHLNSITLTLSQSWLSLKALTAFVSAAGHHHWRVPKHKIANFLSWIIIGSRPVGPTRGGALLAFNSMTVGAVAGALGRFVLGRAATLGVHPATFTPSAGPFFTFFLRRTGFWFGLISGRGRRRWDAAIQC